MREPKLPTEEERREHELCHLPFKPWCRLCIMGKAKEDQHRRTVEHEDEERPNVVQMDYCFLTAAGHFVSEQRPD
eukprot:5334657-Lingulodinium_polyedra.AAC.1